jgi:HSP20 family molecular chaperone IbpA
MGKSDDERQGAARADRVRGLRDIRTLGGLGSSARPRPVRWVPNVRLGFAQRPGPPAPGLPTERPRTWVFLTRPRFTRHQGLLLVDQLVEPDVEVFEEEEAVVVLAGLPGVREEDIEVQVNGDVLTLCTRPPGLDLRRRYYRELLLPFPVLQENVQRAFRNGVLELELGRASSLGATRRKQP